MNAKLNKKLKKIPITLVVCFGLQSTYVNADDTNEIIVSTKQSIGGSYYPAVQSVIHGQQATILVTPEAGYKITGIQGCGGRYENQLFIIPKATYSCTVTAEFSEVAQQQTIANPQQSDATTPVSTTSTTTQTTEPYGLAPKKLKLLLMADYVTNYVTASATVTSGQGTITPVSQRVRKGGTATFSVTPAQGYIVSLVSGCGVTGVNAGVITTPALPADCTITVRFAAPQQNLWDQFNWDNANWG